MVVAIKKSISQKICLLPILITLLIGVNSCIDRPSFISESELKVSRDTVAFDTLFTRQNQTGTYPISVTKLIYIKNPEDQWVKADFEIAGGGESSFSMNIDGLSGPKIEQLEIAPKDSVFVFIQCRLEANNETKPAIIMDSLITRVSTGTSKVILTAWGWDAHYLKDSVIHNSLTLSDKTKPYVFIGNIVVAPNSTLTVNPGVRLYASAYTGIYVFGNTIWQGNAQERIIIRGDKPLTWTDKLPSQWGGIYFAPGATGSFEYADITNASIGIRADSTALGNAPCVSLKQCKIQYCGQACLLGFGGAIEAENCLFADAGSYTFLGYHGGWYRFNHCTFSDFSYFSNRQDGHWGITNTMRDGLGKLLSSNDLTLKIENSIIWGYQKDEISTDKVDQSAWSTDFSYSNLKSLNSDNLLGGDNVTFNLDPVFNDYNEGDYTLDSTSTLLKKSNINTTLSVDLLGNTRNIPGDLGAYEYK